MKRIVSIDFGLKRCGLAISNPTQTMALPWTTVEPKQIISTITKRKEEIEGIIIGLPLLMSGAKSEMAGRVEAFAKELEIALQMPVALFDERLSSKHAEAVLRETGDSRKSRSAKTDEVAATLLLQSYLDSRK
ncbi:MAG TPA: Holliday junction resolvase RuvX [Chlamydiales bacterium]|nr:Holliday junction resolvase RuvX [Chlamydiales bacterium]